MSSSTAPAPTAVAPPADDARSGGRALVLSLSPGATGTPASRRPVLAAALTLLDARLPITLVCALDHEPALADLTGFVADCADVIDLTAADAPDVLLTSRDQAARVAAVARLDEGGDVRAAVAVLQEVVVAVGTGSVAAGPAAAAATVGPVPAAPAVDLTPPARTRPAPDPPTSAPSTPAPPSPAPSDDDARLARAHELMTALRERADAVRRERADRRVHLLVVAQHQHTWGALVPIVLAAAAREDASVSVVLLDDPRGVSSADAVAALAARGVPVRDASDPALLDGIDVAVLCDPYEEYRPPALHLDALLDRGIRLVLSPYAENIGGEVTRQYDTPLHNLAWRVFAADDAQVPLYARHCRSGARHVRSLGSVKADWIAGDATAADRGAALRRALGTPVVVLWNPHFRMGEDGWSTFEVHLPELLRLLATTPQVGLLVRPHPRLFSDTEASGPAGRAVVASIREAFAALPNALLDETRDYRPAFAASDAMISDLSSLIPEYLRTGKPVAYLRHPTPPATVADEGWVSRVTVVDDAVELAAHLRAVAPCTASDAPSPHVGAGARVVAAVVEDVRREVWGR